MPVGKVYAADLIGASLGCLAAIVMMQEMDAPSAVLIVAAAIIGNGLMFCPRKPGKLSLIHI